MSLYFFPKWLIICSSYSNSCAILKAFPLKDVFNFVCLKSDFISVLECSLSKVLPDGIQTRLNSECSELSECSRRLPSFSFVCPRFSLQTSSFTTVECFPAGIQKHLLYLFIVGICSVKQICLSFLLSLMLGYVFSEWMEERMYAIARIYTTSFFHLLFQISF